MGIWYKVGGYDKEIKKVNVIKETSNFIVVRREHEGETYERRTAKESSYRSYFKTYNEAYKHGLDAENRKIEIAEERLADAKVSKLKFIDANPEPGALPGQEG